MRKVIVQVLLVLVLLAGTGGLPHPEGTIARAHGLVTQMAAQSPEEIVTVIVQKADRTNRAETYAQALGGVITKDLSIINAFVVRIKAKDALKLAFYAAVAWVSLDAEMESSMGEVVFTTWATDAANLSGNSFTNLPNMADSPIGPNDVFSCGSNSKISLSGFMAETNPLLKISKVEVVMQAYVPAPLAASDDLKMSFTVGGVNGTSKSVNTTSTYDSFDMMSMSVSLDTGLSLDSSAVSPLNPKVVSIFDDNVGIANKGLDAIDLTSVRSWTWADFDKGLELVFDQTKFDKNHYICYDAVGLRVTSLRGIDLTTAASPTNLPKAAIDASKLVPAFTKAVRATNVWNEAPAYLQGQGVSVAVVDSGVVRNKDLSSRLIKSVNFNLAYHNANDLYGHGTFVAGIVAGSGLDSSGQYIGIAPKTNIINVRVSDDIGRMTESSVVLALQWVLENKTQYNIRVVNLSLNSTVAQSYNTSPLDAACEILWFNGIVVVVSAGNNGTATLFPPANDPFVITVGSVDDKGTVALADDAMTTFSAYGTTSDGFVKPDLVAPGKNIVAYLGDVRKLSVGVNHPANVVNTNYFRMSGTSVSAPIVSGAVALLLQDEPGLNPDQVKYRLKNTAVKTGWAYDAVKAGAGYLDIYAAVKGTTTQTANTGQHASRLLYTGPKPLVWGSADWNSADWNSADWNSADWNSADWNSADWNSDYWGP